MAMLPKQIADHLREELPVRKGPIRCRQPSVMTGNVRARDNEKERRARHYDCEPMNPTRHKNFESRISDCGFPKCLLRTKYLFKSAFRIPKSAITLVFSEHRELDRRQHLKRTGLTAQLGTGPKGKVSSRCAACGDCYLHRLLCSGARARAFVPIHDRVFARRHALDREAPIFAADRKERVLQNTDVSFHPWMLVALDGS